MKESQSRSKTAQEKLLDRQVLSATALALREQWFTNRVIANKLGIPESTVRKVLNAQWAEGGSK